MQRIMVLFVVPSLNVLIKMIKDDDIRTVQMPTRDVTGIVDEEMIPLIQDFFRSIFMGESLLGCGLLQLAQ